MSNKHEVIDNTIRLLEKMHAFPIFKVYYKLSVDNELYENHIMKREDNNRFYNLNGKRFDNETIDSIRQQDIKTFRKSRGYNPNDKSEILYSQVVKLEDVGYILIWNIMNFKTEFGEFKKFCFDMDEKTVDDFYNN